MGWLAQGLPCPWGAPSHVMSYPLLQLGLGCTSLSAGWQGVVGGVAAAGTGSILSQKVLATNSTGGGLSKAGPGWVGGGLRCPGQAQLCASVVCL